MNAPSHFPVVDAVDAKTAALDVLLARIAERGAVALASSLSLEDMVLTDAILRGNHAIEIFTLDTGRLHGDTLAVIDAVHRKYGYRIARYQPLPHAIERYVAECGRDGFYESVEARKRCCAIRKLEPLERALRGRNAWITGLRRSQSVTRERLEIEELDTARGIAKFNPLAEWSEEDIWSYIREHAVPYNALYDQGYRSIGCAPCSRPVVAGENVRAGRWWWETPETKECGLHVAPDGRLVRSKASP